MDFAVGEKLDDDNAADGLWVLPESWCWTQLGNILPIAYGKALPDKDRTGSGEFSVFGSSGPVGSHDKYIAPANSIMVGRKGSAGSVFYSKKPSWPIDTAYFTSGSAAIDIRYGYWFLWFRKLGRLDQSTAIPSLSRDIYDVQPIPLAPLPEQRRIVARVDALVAEIADGEAALAATRKGLDTFRRALLKAAVTGELTKDWRGVNPATETGHDLLARIAKVRVANDTANGRGRRNADIPPIDTATLPELPKDWVWAKVGDLLEFVTSGSRGWKEFYADDGAIFVRAQNINSGVLNLSDVAFVRLPHHAEGLRTRLRVNDVLVTITGANVTVSARVTQDLPEAYVNQHVALLRPILPETSEFILLWLQADGAGKSQLVDVAYGAGKPGLNLDNIRNVSIALPPPAEATEILRRVSDALSATADTFAMLEAEAADVGRLKQSILKAAFEGRLIRQDPADEPAAALLDRLASYPTVPRAKRGRTKRDS